MILREAFPWWAPRRRQRRGWRQRREHGVYLDWRAQERGLDPHSGIENMGGWFKLDDSISDHPKILRLPWYSELAHMRALAYANRKETDGDLPDAIVGTFFRGFEKHMQEGIDALTKQRVWHRNRRGDGYAIHDFIESGLNTPHAKREESRKQKAAAGSAGGLAKAEKERRAKLEKERAAKNGDLPAPNGHNLYTDSGETLAESWQGASSLEEGELPPPDDRVEEETR